MGASEGWAGSGDRGWGAGAGEGVDVVAGAFLDAGEVPPNNAPNPLPNAGLDTRRECRTPAGLSMVGGSAWLGVAPKVAEEGMGG